MLVVLVGVFSAYAQPTQNGLQSRHLLNGHHHNPGGIFGGHFRRPHHRPPILPFPGLFPGVVPPPPHFG